MQTDGGFDDWHTVGMHWAPQKLTYYLNGQAYHTITSGEWWSTADRSVNTAAPFDQEFYLILNLAVGGALPAAHGAGPIASADFPIRLQVDWVRVWVATVAEQ